MMTPVKRVNRFFMLLTAPFLGLLICMWWYRPPLELDLDVGQFTPISGPLNETANLKGFNPSRRHCILHHRCSQR